jgi:DNA-directed RNA polymerase subunit RPC12/RpoP
VIKFKCIYCGQRILAKDDGRGKKGKCPKCKHLLVVPEYTKGRPAISSIKEPMPDQSKPYVPAWEAGSGFNKNEAKEELIDLFKESFGFLVPAYDKLSLFLMAVTWILLYAVNSHLRGPIHAYFIEAHNWKVTVMVLSIPVTILIMGIYQVFTKREKSDEERAIMLYFAIATNVFTGIIAAVYIIKNTEVHSWQLIFPVWNIVNAVVLYLMLVANCIDENCIIDRQPTPAQIILGLVATIIIVLVCNYVFKLHWAITFSICIIYTTSFDRALQSVFPVLAGQNDEQSEV